MAVAVEPDRAHVAGTVVAAAHAVEREVDDALPRGQEITRDEIVLEQPVARLAAEAGGIERRPTRERPCRPDRVDATDETADPLQRVGIVELRHAPAAPRIDREAEAAGLVQRLPGEYERRDDRNLALGELERERVLLVDLSVGPARRAVELGDHDGPVFEIDLVHAVFVAVQREEAPVAAHAGRLERVEHGIGREVRIGVPAHRRPRRYSASAAAEATMPTAHTPTHPNRLQARLARNAPVA